MFIQSLYYERLIKQIYKHISFEWEHRQVCNKCNARNIFDRGKRAQHVGFARQCATRVTRYNHGATKTVATLVMIVTLV